MTYGLFLLVSLIFGALCHYLAAKRGGRAVFWGVMGVVFGPLALPFLFMANRNQPR